MASSEIERLQQKNAKLTLLMEVSRSIMADNDPDRLLRDIIASVKKVMNSDLATLFLVDNESKELVSRVTLDGSEIRVPLGSGIVGHVAQSGETVNIADAYEDDRFNRAFDQESGYRTRAILCMAIPNQDGDIIGAVQVFNKLDGDYFIEEDEEILAAFTALAGISLENARAYDELEQERNSLDTKVKERTRQLQLAKEATDQILNTVAQGLFLLLRSGDQYTIDEHHSAALPIILQTDTSGQRNFLELVEDFANDKTVANVHKYLNLLFDKSNSEKMLNKLNPLREIEAAFAGGDIKKSLRFEFTRIIRNKEIQQLMVTVTDATQEVLLSRKLEEAEEENKRQMELLYAILKIDPDVLAEFIEDVEEDLALINNNLRQGDSMRGRLGAIFRSMHTIKGNSSVLNLDVFANRAHDCENEISAILGREEIAGEDFVPLALKVNEFHATLKEVKSLIKKLKQFQAGGNTDFTLDALESTIARLAPEQGKQISFEHRNYTPTHIPRPYRKPLKDILVQLVRNAIVHGIESVAERNQRGKNNAGTISVSSALENQELRVVFEDDGRGLKLKALKQRAIEGGHLDASAAEGLTPAETARLIYLPGLTTASGASMTAGRGVGMDIIKKKIEALGGRISLASRPGSFTRFTIRLPTQPTG